MGQGASQPQRPARAAEPCPVSRDDERDRRRRRRASRFSISDLLETHHEEGLLSGQHSGSRRPPTRSNSTNRLSRLLHSSTEISGPDVGSSQRSRLQRSRTTLSNIFRRDSQHAPSVSSRPHGIMQHRASYIRTPGMNTRDAGYTPPRLPSIDRSSTFDHDLFGNAADDPDPPRSSNSHRRPNLRFNALRPDRPFRHLTSSLRRRRSPPPPSLRRPVGTEDQAAMLSRLLSVAAAATAATLMGDDHHALSEARSLTGGTGIGDMGGSGEDGSFDGFLRALQNGRIASALRSGGDGLDSDNASATNTGSVSPLNFFRMFRFGASGPQSADSQQEPSPSSAGIAEPNNSADGRMVPIIIVGIRSISPGSNAGSGSAADELPPFIDALGNFPSPLPATALGTEGHESIDSILRPPQNGTSFRHRRRASMSNFGMGRSRSAINDRLDDQRDHRSPDRRRERPRPWSVASSSMTENLEPRPPPATPASPSPELSRISSRNTTPSHSRPASFVANSVRDFGDSRRNSAIAAHRASAASPLSAHTEETISLHSTHSGTNLLDRVAQPERDSFRLHRRSDTAPNIHYPRFASGHPRRNGVVEPDNLPSLSRNSTATDTTATTNNEREGRSSGDSRSWIIYVLGGSYPENHPILTTPSLFTENPTYEDMMLLSALLGPAKPPVATEEDVQSAGGIYNIETVHTEAELATQQPGQPEVASDITKTVSLVAQAVEGSDRVVIEVDQRCLVCLCDFEAKEVARKLQKCSHLFHKECIDHWLTQGRNSCPLCRAEGVHENKTDESAEEAPAEAAAAA